MARSAIGTPTAPRIQVIHGPNLGILGIRNPDVYGTTTLAEIDRELARRAKARGAVLRSSQSNIEGEIVTLVLEARTWASAIVINPAGYTHTSVAIRDAIEGAGVPTVEVHLSNLHARERFRQESLTAGKCIGTICGFGPQSYYLGLDAALSHVEATVPDGQKRQGRR